MDFARPAKDTELANVTLSGDDGIEGSGASDPEGSGGGRRVSILKTIMKQVKWNLECVCYIESCYNFLICFLETTSS